VCDVIQTFTTLHRITSVSNQGQRCVVYQSVPVSDYIYHESLPAVASQKRELWPSNIQVAKCTMFAHCPLSLPLYFFHDASCILVKGAFTHTRGAPRLASPMVSEVRLMMPVCVYGVTSTSGATAIQSYKNGGEMNIH